MVQHYKNRNDSSEVSRSKVNPLQNLIPLHYNSKEFIEEGGILFVRNIHRA